VNGIESWTALSRDLTWWPVGQARVGSGWVSSFDLWVKANPTCDGLGQPSAWPNPKATLGQLQIWGNPKDSQFKQREQENACRGF
jgi:hypothetical protein